MWQRQMAAGIGGGGGIYRLALAALAMISS